MKPWFEKEGKTGKGMEGRKTATDLWDIKSAIQKQCWGHDAALVSWWISGVRILEHWEHHSQPRHNSSLITISTSAAQQNKLSHYEQRKAACSSWVELGDRSGAQFCDPRCPELAVLIRWSTDSTALKALPNFLCCESWEGGNGALFAPRSQFPHWFHLVSERKPNPVCGLGISARWALTEMMQCFITCQAKIALQNKQRCEKEKVRGCI